MYYDKRIRYLSYYESDIKLQNAGYVKFQVRDSLCQMIIYVKGPRLIGSGEAAVYLLSRNRKGADEDSFYTGSRDSGIKKHLLGNLNIRGGQGHCAVRLDAENMADSGLRYDEICGIKIVLHEYQYLESQWSVVNFMPEKYKSAESGTVGYTLRKEQNVEWGGTEQDAPAEVNLIVTPVSERSRCVSYVAAEEEQKAFRQEEQESAGEEKDEEERQQENTGEEKDTEERPQVIVITEDAVITEDTVIAEEPSVIENSKGNTPGDEDSMQGMLEREIRREQTLEEEVMEGIKGAENREEESAVQILQEELPPDKWEQLRRAYPIVHPIREDEEYLKISPKDFVIFTEKYQELVHNSFLLHGYYNYKHLILGKKVKEGRTVYYLGVPGTFHDREKSVAVMFGFEAFDGKREPAEKGDFGYYLRRVEI
ncbi:MAG: hypothetical protein K2P64_02155 [Lachnospiraceae bacterium]|nr:hypothetical protein [Lachnospiraceae bacterium]